jgi:hypothetical protein
MTIDDQYVELRENLVDHMLAGGRLAVVKAPPGSGKTFMLIEVLAALVAEGWRIAVAAQTNNQADDICRRFSTDHSKVGVIRFSSKGNQPPSDFPATVPWISVKDDLPGGAGVTVATTAKWSLTDLARPFDLLAIDESWQMSWADMMQCALVSEKFLMIGDPGQIPPVVTIDVRRWETSPRAPHEAAPAVVLRETMSEDERFVGSLPACRRLPNEAVDFVKPFYDFNFEAYSDPGTRGVDLPTGHRLASLADGRPLAVTVPTPANGPPVEVDHELAVDLAQIVDELLESNASIRDGRGPARPLVPGDLGISSSHRVMNAALAAAVTKWSDGIRVDTPERWQGLERPVMIAVHPLSGVVDPSAFDLETGRLCVMASRHQAGLIIVTRDHVGATLTNFIPSSGQAPGRPDTVGRGHDAHLRFWTALELHGRLVPFT